jgi:hypothetical protein
MLMQGERNGDRLDAAIDAAARSLTAGEPSSSLRAAVQRRIAHRRNASWLVPAAAVAAVLVVALVGRTLSDPSGPGGMEMPRLPAKPNPPVLVTGPRAVMEATDVRRVVATTLSSPPPAMDTPDAPPEEPAPMIPPIAIEPLETKLITVETSSGVLPIEIEPLQIEPLRGG